MWKFESSRAHKEALMQFRAFFVTFEVIETSKVFFNRSGRGVFRRGHRVMLLFQKLDFFILMKFVFYQLSLGLYLTTVVAFKFTVRVAQIVALKEQITPIICKSLIK